MLPGAARDLEDARDPGVVDRVALLDADERRDAQAHRHRVDDRAVAGDDPGRLQFAHALVHRR